ncbi:Hypothetical protein A7982_02235 [Minicystis rosea]|nr:Hypothetical protein A7982_02235 [Minicystis rosea]
MTIAAPAHDLTWVAAAPLWKGVSADRTRMRRPALLRFTSDAFMDELFAVLRSQAPETLANRVPAPEAGSDTLKLYQPVHGHFHLVAASLVCQRPGLPDHGVNAARDEKAAFVLRRVVGGDELAWIPATDPSKPGAWKKVDDKESILPDEELLPLFPAIFTDAAAHPRKLHFGVIPTSSREVFQAAIVTDPAKVTDDGEAVLAASDLDPNAALVPKLGTRAGMLFTVRCVYRKPRCEPREAPLLSDASARFTIGGVMDPDAPARQIRIPMPLDVSVDGLKKFKRSVGFVLSNQLRKQLSTIADAKKALKGETDAPDAADQGEMWIFAIPIITMVAMIILMIIATLLNIVFFWMPFLKIKIPIKLKG